MKKAIIFIIQIVIVLSAAMFLIRYQLPMTITLNDYELTTNSSFFLLFLFVFMGVFSVFYKILEAICYGPGKIKKKFDYKKKLKGLDAIVNGLFFLSIDNNKKALKEAKKASQKIPKHVMTHFLSAKAYLADGNFEKAKKEYKKVVSEPKHMSLGFNGLIEIANMQNKDEDIYNLAKQAVLIDGKNSYALLNLIDCQIDQNLIEEAQKNIKKASSLNAIDKDQTKLRLAEIAYINAVRLQEQGDIEKALKEIEKYYNLDLDYLDLYVGLLLANKQARKAKNIIKKEWQKNPYNQIASIWMCFAPKDNIKKVSHAKELLKDWANSHIAFELVAKACIDAEIWGEARTYLTKAIETEEKISHFLLMAKVEKLGFKDHGKHEFWLKKAEKGIE
jgi:HemY protein